MYAIRPGIDEPAPRRSRTTPVASGDARRPREDAREAAQRRAPPGDQRPDPHQQQQRQAEDAEEEVVVRAAHDDGLAPHRLRDDRPGDAPEDRQAERDEEQVVVEERRLARDERLEPRARCGAAAAEPDHQRVVKTTAITMKARNHGPISLCVNEWIELTIPERVRNVPKSERQNASATSDDVPDLQHPALLLDHHRVQERGGDEPRHQRRVLDRVPRVVAAPADLLT